MASPEQAISREMPEAGPLSAEETSDVHTAAGQGMTGQLVDPSVEPADAGELDELRAVEEFEEDEYFEL